MKADGSPPLSVGVVRNPLKEKEHTKNRPWQVLHGEEGPHRSVASTAAIWSGLRVLLFGGPLSGSFSWYVVAALELGYWAPIAQGFVEFVSSLPLGLPRDFRMALLAADLGSRLS